MSVPMALVDYIPVFLFLLSSLVLLRDLYRAMSKGAYALLAAGLLMICVAGIFKATWKLLYGAGVCDFEALNRCFFPMQSTGFLLAGTAMVCLICIRQHRSSALSVAAAPAVFSGTMIFVAVMVLGVLSLCGCLAVLALRLKRKKTAVLFLLSFVLLLMMGYLSSRDFTQAMMNWIAQGINIAAQTCLFAGVLSLHGAKLGEVRDVRTMT